MKLKWRLVRCGHGIELMHKISKPPGSAIGVCSMVQILFFLPFALCAPSAHKRSLCLITFKVHFLKNFYSTFFFPFSPFSFSLFFFSVFLSLRGFQDGIFENPTFFVRSRLTKALSRKRTYNLPQ